MSAILNVRHTNAGLSELTCTTDEPLPARCFAVQECARRCAALHLHGHLCPSTASFHVSRAQAGFARVGIQGVSHRHTPQPVRFIVLPDHGGRGSLLLIHWTYRCGRAPIATSLRQQLLVWWLSRRPTVWQTLASCDTRHAQLHPPLLQQRWPSTPCAYRSQRSRRWSRRVSRETTLRFTFRAIGETPRTRAMGSRRGRSDRARVRPDRVACSVGDRASATRRRHPRATPHGGRAQRESARRVGSITIYPLWG